MPSWSQWWLPYSRQAGEALKAQFPTQWPTIRDYGWQHPEIVPYVNQYPIGWGNIIVGYQLCEYIQSNGNQWIYYPFTFANNIEYFRMKFSLGSLGIAWALGSWTDSSGNLGLNIDGYNGCRFCLGYGNVNGFNLSSWNLAANVMYDIEWENGQVKMEGKTPLSVNAGKPSNNAISIFSLYNPNKYGSYSGKFGGLEIKAGQSETMLYPCYNKESGIIGAYDVANNAFRTNAGSGTFLKGSDIYYPGQSPA